MIRLKPEIDIKNRACPKCRSNLIARRFLIPGTRNLADLSCSGCGSEFYGDLEAGQALYSPCFIDKQSGDVFDDQNVEWFSEQLARSYRERKNEAIDLKILRFADRKSKVIFLNCLDELYGHCLLKLLNAQRYLDNSPNFSLIVLVPKFLEWMLPDGIAEAWILDLPLRRGTEWNDWLDAEIQSQFGTVPELYLSRAFSHPHSEDFEIDRFTRVAPMPLDQLQHVGDSPKITFIYRADRTWDTPDFSPDRPFGRFFARAMSPLERQIDQIVGYAESVRASFPRVDFCVAGIGDAGGLPSWILDLRRSMPDPTIERLWCERYAQSHLVVGVHGSNMLLPSAHSAAVIELIPEDRWGNFLQDILFRISDPRDMFFRYRFQPLSTSAASLARLTSDILRYKHFIDLMGRSSRGYSPDASTTRYSREDSRVRD